MNNFYNVKDIKLKDIINKDNLETVTTQKYIRKQKTNIEYYNIPVSFDIESSSWYDENDDKVANMYIWQMDFNGFCFYGRTWNEYIATLQEITEILELDYYHRIIIYVHNLAYEFQFMRKWLDVDTVFSVGGRQAINVVTNNGIEFKCSYILSNKSLASVADDLYEHKIEKLKGDLDYTLIRHSETPLTDEELGYCLNDVKILEYYIREKMKDDGDITKIKLTSTGYVRSYVRDHCLGNDITDRAKRRKQNVKYRKLMRALQIQSVDEFKQLLRAFMGGFTHANPIAVGRTWHNGDSIDFTSSYPAVMVCKYFPMSDAETIKIRSKAEFLHNINHYCCMFDIEFHNLRSKIDYENYFSYSKGLFTKEERDTNNVQLSNGRVVSADMFRITLTELDYKIAEQCYDWDSVTIYNFRRYHRGYLPKEIVECVLKFYNDKTTLKDVEGKERQYGEGKSLLNAIYGMIVTSICKDLDIYVGGEWDVEKANIEEVMNEYNKDQNRFLFYPWGIWVTAHARANLWTGILEYKDDYLYSDTDSIKGINTESHRDYINRYNNNIDTMMKKALEYHGLPLDSYKPKTIKGIEKPLGYWDDDGHFDTFKTLGAKRYLTECKGKYKLTTAGVNKYNTRDYLVKKAEENKCTPFDLFKDDLVIPKEHAGKLCRTYIDIEQDGYVQDYLGNWGEYHELTTCHLSESDYHLSLSDDFIDYLKGLEIKYDFVR